MRINYTTTKSAGTVAEVNTGDFNWTDDSNALVDDANSAFTATGPGGGTAYDLQFTNFGFDLPPFARIDGVEINLDCARSGTAGFDTMVMVSDLGTGSSGDSINWPLAREVITYGSDTNLWGLELTPAVINDSDFGFYCNYFHGSSFFNQYVYFQSITVHWSIDLATAEADVPTRFAYKTYDREGNYIGDLPKVASEFKFSQDINSAGSSLEVMCGVRADNTTTTEVLLTEAELDILTESGEELLAEETTFLVISGDSDIEALFKNGNRVEVYMYNYWYPNGKKMFQGQINKVQFSYGGNSDAVKLTVFSDGYDLTNYIARGFPFSYTTDVSQTTSNSVVTVETFTYGGWNRYGQSWTAGVGITNLGAITLRVFGTADVTVTVYSQANGSVLGSVTRSVSAGAYTDIDFELPALIDLVAGNSYFFGVSVPSGQSINLRTASGTEPYTGGNLYVSSYAGGSGGGSYLEVTESDLYFITKEGEPTTTATYSSQDPISGMLSPILQDYNNRGGRVTEGSFTAAGTTTTYTFNVATIFDAMKKCLEMSPSGFYTYIDLGTSEMEVAQVASVPDFTIVRGKDIHQIVMGLSIEQLKNYLLFTGGDTGGGTNLFQDYKDTESQNYYGLRTVAKTDNRVTVSATADAIGESFIAENASELQQTTVQVLNRNIDITLLTPGKTVGFRNFGSFIDDLTLQIVRRDYTPDKVTLTLGQLPVRLNDELQETLRGLLNEQTVDNPTAPS